MREVFLIGHPVSSSLSPIFQNAGFKGCGASLRYSLLDVPPGALERELARLDERTCAGANITVPWKAAAFAHAKYATDTARLLGAANTYYWRGGQLAAGVSDHVGVWASLMALDLPRDARVAVLGAGGAARAVAYACVAWLGARGGSAGGVDVFCRRPERAAPHWSGLLAWAKAKGHELALAPWSQLTEGEAGAARLSEVDLIVDATSIVTLDASAQRAAWDALPWGALRVGALALDLSVRAEPTAFSRRVAEAGVSPERRMDGAVMLLYQGVASWHLWLPGVEPPLEAMRDALAGALDRTPESLPLVMSSWQSSGLGL